MTQTSGKGAAAATAAGKTSGVRASYPADILYYYSEEKRSCSRACQLFNNRTGKMATDESNGGFLLPEKWSEDLVDEKGEKMSKRCVYAY